MAVTIKKPGNRLLKRYLNPSRYYADWIGLIFLKIVIPRELMFIGGEPYPISEPSL